MDAPFETAIHEGSRTPLRISRNEQQQDGYNGTFELSLQLPLNVDWPKSWVLCWHCYDCFESRLFSDGFLHGSFISVKCCCCENDAEEGVVVFQHHLDRIMLDTDIKLTWLSRRYQANHETAGVVPGTDCEPTNTSEGGIPPLPDGSFHPNTYREPRFSKLSEDTCRILVYHISRSLAIDISFSEALPPGECVCGALDECQASTDRPIDYECYLRSIFDQVPLEDLQIQVQGIRGQIPPEQFEALAIVLDTWRSSLTYPDSAGGPDLSLQQVPATLHGGDGLDQSSPAKAKTERSDADLSNQTELSQEGATSRHRPLRPKHECSNCKTDQTTQWRSGPNGKNEFCNACGIEYSKQQRGMATARNKKRRMRRAQHD